MDKATLDQVSKILEALKGTPRKKLQKIIESGIFADLRDGSIENFDRNKFRKMLGLNLVSSLPSFSIFCSILAGTHSSVDSLRQDLLNEGHSISVLGAEILNKISLVKDPLDLDLVIVSNTELGFPKGATFQQTCTQAKKLFGLRLCPAESAPQLLRQRGTFLKNEETLMFAMKPVTDSNGCLRVFRVSRNDRGVSWLGGDYGRPDLFYCSSALFVFVSCG